MPLPRSDRDELLAELIAERHNGGGWVRTKPRKDDDIICAQRRRVLAEVEPDRARRSA